MKKLNKQQWKTILILGGVLLVFALLTLKIGMPLVKFCNNPQQFRAWLNDQGIFSFLYMIAIIFLQIVVAFIPGEPFEIAAGYAFGFWQGTLLCLIGSALASALVMVLVKKWGTKLIYVFFSKDKLDELWLLKDEKKLNFWTFIAFFIPGSPKDVMTYAIGLTNMKLTTFILISTIARIPSVITSTFSGHALGEENYWVAIASFIFTLVISIIGLWCYAMISKKKTNAKKAV